MSFKNLHVKFYDTNNFYQKTGGEHTRTKAVGRSKVGGLAAFTKVRETCIGCKTPLTVEG